MYAPLFPFPLRTLHAVRRPTSCHALSAPCSLSLKSPSLPTTQTVVNTLAMTRLSHLPPLKRVRRFVTRLFTNRLLQLIRLLCVQQARFEPKAGFPRVEYDGTRVWASTVYCRSNRDTPARKSRNVGIHGTSDGYEEAIVGNINRLHQTALGKSGYQTSPTSYQCGVPRTKRTSCSTLPRQRRRRQGKRRDFKKVPSKRNAHS